VKCSIPEDELRATYMNLQRTWHPDKFAAAGNEERLRAVQIASFVNEAHKTLASPLKRAEYCLHLHGGSADSETDAKMDSMFLMEQMEWRETLEDINPASEDSYAAIDALRAEIKQSMDKIAAQTAQHLDDKDLDGARDALRKWQFLVKLVAEADSVEAQLDETLH